MLYFKITASADQRRRRDNSIYIANELYTPAEKERYKIPENYYIKMDIPKNKIYWLFGARFAQEGAMIK